MKLDLSNAEISLKSLYEYSQQPIQEVAIGNKRLSHALKYREIVDAKLKDGGIYYGINTGFGNLAHISIPKDDLAQLQLNLIRSHAVGVGKPLEPKLVRCLLILRLHSFLHGHSGVSEDIILMLKAMIEHDILPFIPEQGSVGACGDLAPLSHLALCLIGEGKVYDPKNHNTFRPTLEVLSERKLEPICLKAKEGLSLINGTHFSTAIACFCVVEAKSLLDKACAAVAMSLSAFRGTLTAFDPRIHALRKHQGQVDIAQKVRSFFKADDAIMSSHLACDRVQDPYSFRCVPQVYGPVLECLNYAQKVVEKELNSVTDNPLVMDDGSILSGGNFHAEPIGMVMDFLAIAVAEIASMSEQRVMKLCMPAMSELPAFLTPKPGLNSGFMIPHVVAASLVSENKILCHPASVDSIPTSADKEDHVSMAPIAARKARQVVQNTAKVIAIELLAGAQGLDLLKPLEPSPKIKHIYHQVREHAPFMDQDASLHEAIEALAVQVLSHNYDGL
jgi:histidine ammonia-lyase